MQAPPDDPLGPLRRALSRAPLSSSRDLMAQLGLSQPTFSRLVRRAATELVVVGKARATRYAWRRPVSGVPACVPVYELQRDEGRPRHVADLWPAAPAGFVVVGHAADVRTGWYDDVPWFLQELRPSGWLGRQVPALYPDLRVPPSVNDWSSDDVLRFLVLHGYDGLGAFVVGATAFERAVALAQHPPAGVPIEARGAVYAARADAAVQQGTVGSSAGGEQPKFLALRAGDGGGVPVLVKFSPAATDAVALRRRDLLVCEHLALCTLRDHGQRAARTELVIGEQRAFLEVERFDRHGPARRVGQIALAWLDAERVGSSGRSWAESTARLCELGVLDAASHRTVRWLELFGRWIANTDMHMHNLTLHLRGTVVDGVAPAYDMLPMAFAPRGQGELHDVAFVPPAPSATDADIAEAVLDAALDFWGRVAADARVSDDLRALAREHRQAVAALRPTLAWLPEREG